MPSLRLAALILIAGLTGPLFAGALTPAVAQTPPAPPPAADKPAAKDKPAIPAPDAPSPLKPGDAFGEAVTLPPRTIISFKGHSSWDAAFDTLVDAYKQLNQYLDKQGIKPNGPQMTIYTDTDDNGFGFLAALPIAEAPKEPPKGDISVGQAPSGKAYKFVHRGSYDAMDTTYEAITNYLDEKQIDAKDQFIEEYVTDITKSDPDKLVVNIFVPVK